MGPSGCGKSTLLHLLGGIDRPTTGRLVVDGQDLTALDEEGLTHFRRARVGFVFQFYNLLPTLTALGNVELPLIALGLPRRQRRTMAGEVLKRVGLGDRLDHKPGELSGGEQQRVAIARAIVAERRLLLADEPTGDLDSQAAAQVVDILHRLNRDLGLTVVLVTHDPVVGAAGARRIILKDGLIVADERNGRLGGG
ncbi:MAG: ABC transporter ATP-binding protein [Chloroflexota bacterium]